MVATLEKNSLPERISSSLRDEPYRHAIIHPALPWNLYWALWKDYPSPDVVVGSRVVQPNKLYQMHAYQVLGDNRITSLWRHFFSEVVGESFTRAMLSNCRDVPDGKIGVRYRDPCDIESDCLFGVNTPVKKAGTVKGPHLDNPRELFACLIYFPFDLDDAGGDLGIYRYSTDRPKWRGQRLTDDVEIVDRVPYQHNTGIFFQNGPKALHGVLPRQETETYRRYVNIEAEFKAPLFSLP